MLLYLMMALLILPPVVLILLADRKRLPLQDRGFALTYVILAVLWSTPFSFGVIFWVLEMRAVLRLPWIRIDFIDGPFYLGPIYVSFAAVLVVILLLTLMTARLHRLIVFGAGVVTYLVWAPILGIWALSQYRG